MNDNLVSNLESIHADAFGWTLHCCGGDHGRAEDVLQNSYLKVLQGRSRFDGQASLKTWWFGLIRLTALEEFRRLRYRESLLGRLMNALRPGGRDSVDPRPTPQRQTELNEQANQLRALMSQLPARQAEVLHLVFYQDMPLVEAAVIMRVSVGSARQHYERGKTKLRAMIEPLPHFSIYEPEQ